MSQEKVNLHKQEKYERKHPPKKSKLHVVRKYALTTVVCVALLFLLGAYIAVHTGMWKPEVETTSQAPWSDAQKESLRNALIQNNDTNVKGAKTTQAPSIKANTKTKSTKASKKANSKTPVTASGNAK